MTPPTLATLPSLVWSRIANELSIDSQKAAACVSRDMNRIMMGMSMASFTPRYAGDVRLERDLRWIAARFSKIQSLDLSRLGDGGWFYSVHPYWNDRLKSTILSMTSLCHLNLRIIGSSLTDDDAVQIIQKCPQLAGIHLNSSKLTERTMEAIKGLTHLRYLSLENTGGNPWLAKAIKSLARLNHLSVAGTPFTSELSDAISAHPSLFSLDVTDTGVSEEDLIRLLEKLPNLTSIKLGSREKDDDKITNLAIQFILTKYTGLQELALYSTRRVESQLLPGLLINLACLKSFTYNTCDNGDAIASALASHAANLETLVLSSIGFSNAGILALKKARLPLTTLKIFGARVDNDGLLVLVSAFPDIRILDLGYTRVNREALELLLVLPFLEVLGLDGLESFTQKDEELLSKNIDHVSIICLEPQ